MNRNPKNVCCAFRPNERLAFRSLRAGSQVFALLCVILHTMSLGKGYASCPLVCWACLPLV